MVVSGCAWIACATGAETCSIVPLRLCLLWVQAILFYQLPEHPEFYSELLNLVEEGDSGETPTGAVDDGWAAAALLGCSAAGWLD